MNRTLSRYPVPIIGIAGWKKSGKTTLTTRLVGRSTRRGWGAGAVGPGPRAFRPGAGGRDGPRHRRAGARQVAIVSGARWAIVTELDGAPEPNFEEIVAALEPADLVIVEGYKSAPIPKIEARREASWTKRSLAAEDPRVIAIAADHEVSGESVPVYALDDIDGLVALIDAIVGPLDGRVARVVAEAARAKACDEEDATRATDAGLTGDDDPFASPER